MVEIKYLRNKVKFLGDYLDRYREIHDSIVTIQKMHDISKFQLETLEKTPYEGEEYFHPDFENQLSDDFNFITSVLEPLPYINKQTLELAYANTFAVEAGLCTALEGATVSSISVVKAWGEEFFVKNKIFSDYNHKHEQICLALNKINPELEDLYTKGESTFNRFIGTTASIEDSANQFRNVINKVKGELMDETGFSKKNLWTGLRDNFSIDPSNATISNQIINQGLNFKFLNDRLIPSCVQ
ncbi:hypothetical protein KKB18_13390 [bacterium]|nr:hypothetical protein [bacterium]